MLTPKIKAVVETVPGAEQKSIDIATRLAVKLNEILSIADQVDLVITADSVLIIGTEDSAFLYSRIGDSSTD